MLRPAESRAWIGSFSTRTDNRPRFLNGVSSGKMSSGTARSSSDGSPGVRASAPTSTCRDVFLANFVARCAIAQSPTFRRFRKRLAHTATPRDAIGLLVGRGFV